MPSRGSAESLSDASRKVVVSWSNLIPVTLVMETLCRSAYGVLALRTNKRGRGHTYTYIHACIHTYIPTHTYIHTYIQTDSNNTIHRQSLASWLSDKVSNLIPVRLGCVMHEGRHGLMYMGRRHVEGERMIPLTG